MTPSTLADGQSPWPAFTPRVAFTLIYILAIAIGIAVPVLMSWHVYMVSKGETSIESHDNAYLDAKAKKEGLIYLNPYDMGQRQNLQMFFNVGPEG
jgi:palmitoyltransferase